MLLKDLPDNTSINKIQVKLTEPLIKYYSEYVNNIQEDVWLIGALMGDWFISPSHPTDKTRRLWPMPIEVKPSDLLECGVIQILD